MVISARNDKMRTVHYVSQRLLVSGFKRIVSKRAILTRRPLGIRAMMDRD